MKINKDAQILKKLDPILGQIINEDLEALKSRGNVYESLLRSIISQQISSSAANSIREKFLLLFSGKFPEPKKLLKTSEDRLRSAGLSSSKIKYMKNVAEHFQKEKLGEKKFEHLTDQEIIDDLTKIKGVGEWTVQMILIFSLGRKDVFAYNDLALVSPLLHLYKIKKARHTPKKLREKILKITERWSPHRTLASRYLWHYNAEFKKLVRPGEKKK
jgi:DNA-3-methyladenine glycosylase II